MRTALVSTSTSDTRFISVSRQVATGAPAAESLKSQLLARFRCKTPVRGAWCVAAQNVGLRLRRDMHFHQYDIIAQQ
jgi:hypothetical protein